MHYVNILREFSNDFKHLCTTHYRSTFTFVATTYDRDHHDDVQVSSEWYYANYSYKYTHNVVLTWILQISNHHTWRTSFT